MRPGSGIRNQPRVRRRTWLVVLLVAIALSVILYLFVAEHQEGPPSLAVQPPAAISSVGGSPARLTKGVAATAGGPETVDILVKTCPGADQPLEIATLGEGNPYDTQGHSTLLSAACVALSGNEWCTFKGLPAGRYVVWQGHHTAAFSAGGFGTPAAQDPYRVVLPCETGCAGQITVHAEDACADRGTLQILPHRPIEQVEPLVVLDWKDGQALELFDLPCEPIRLCATGGRCNPACLSEYTAAPWSSWELSMEEGEHYLLQVQREDTGQAIVGAELRSVVAWNQPTPVTNEVGVVQFTLVGKHGFVVLADGYDGRALVPADLQVAPFVNELRLRPTKEFYVSCNQSGAPCPPETLIELTSWSGPRSRPCKWRGVGQWICAGVTGERVEGRLGAARTLPVEIEPPTDVTIELPELDSAICLRWEEGGSCSALAPKSSTNRIGGNTIIYHDRVWVTSGEEATVPLQAGTPWEIQLTCPDTQLYWAGSVMIYTAGTSACQDIVMEPMAQVCLPAGMGTCSLWPQDRPANEVLHFTNNCSPMIPPGRYLLTCGPINRELELRAGEVLEL